MLGVAPRATRQVNSCILGVVVTNAAAWSISLERVTGGCYIVGIVWVN